MKRDIELVRKILLTMEEYPEPYLGIELEIEGYSKAQVNYHLMLMHEAGLISAVDVSSNADMSYLPQWITWNGFEFLEAARDDTRWNKAKNIILKQAGGMIFDVLKEILTKLALQQVSGL